MAKNEDNLMEELLDRINKMELDIATLKQQREIESKQEDARLDILKDAAENASSSGYSTKKAFEPIVGLESDLSDDDLLRAKAISYGIEAAGGKYTFKDSKTPVKISTKVMQAAISAMISKQYDSMISDASWDDPDFDYFAEVLELSYNDAKLKNPDTGSRTQKFIDQIYQANK